MDGSVQSYEIDERKNRTETDMIVDQFYKSASNFQLFLDKLKSKKKRKSSCNSNQYRLKKSTSNHSQCPCSGTLQLIQVPSKSIFKREGCTL